MTERTSTGQPRFAFLRWAAVTVPFIVLLGILSARLTPSGEDNPWFAELVKPDVMPPGIAFPIAWTILYVLMGLALAMILDARGAARRGPALALFAAQMMLNLAWTPVFFGMHQVVPALVIIAVLFVLVVITAVLFGRIRTAAGMLLVPYLAWLAFAGALLFQFHTLNPNAASLVPSGSVDQIQIR